MDNSPSATAFRPRFDWYSATVQASVSDLLDAFGGITSGAAWERSPKPRLGYGMAWRLVDFDGVVGELWAGGMHDHPHIVFTGDGAPAGAALLRECFPYHGMSRGDVVVLDSVMPSVYDDLQRHCLEVAAERRVTINTAGDHLLTMQGRTMYMGAPTSAARLRLYDKEAELRAKLRGNPSKLETIPVGLVRMELQVRPATSIAKRAAAIAEPMDLLGSTAWMRELLKRINLADVEPFSLRRPWRQSDHDRAYWAMLGQYGATFDALLGEAGSPDLVGRNIYNDLTDARRQRLQQVDAAELV